MSEETAALEAFEAIEGLAATSPYKHTFSAPVLYNGKTYESLTFDFGSLTGGDSLDVETELLKKNHPVIIKTVDPEYLLGMCTKACVEPVSADIFRLIPAKDYNRIIIRVRQFLG